MTLLFDVAPVAGGVALFAAAAFFLILASAAFVVFKLLRRTVKMGLRIAIVAIILTVGIAGSIALWAVSSKPTPRPRPIPTSPR